jgi:hypothetical protein
LCGFSNYIIKPQETSERERYPFQLMAPQRRSFAADGDVKDAPAREKLFLRLTRNFPLLVLLLLFGPDEEEKHKIQFRLALSRKMFKIC